MKRIALRLAAAAVVATALVGVTGTAEAAGADRGTASSNGGRDSSAVSSLLRGVSWE